MSVFHHANIEDLKELFGCLFDGLEASEVQNFSGLDPRSYVGSYIDDEGKVVAVCITDLAISAFSASAITMFPKEVAEESIEQGQLEESLIENLFEIMNIGSRLFLTDSTPHLKHHDLNPVNGLEADVQNFLKERNGCEMKAFLVDVPKYGQGQMTLIHR